MFVKQFVKVIKSTNDVGKLESSMRYYKTVTTSTHDGWTGTTLKTFPKEYVNGLSLATYNRIRCGEAPKRRPKLKEEVRWEKLLRTLAIGDI